jgi:hypothetical protein
VTVQGKPRRIRRELGWVVGFEPTTARATVWSSTTELHPPSKLNYIRAKSSRSVATIRRRMQAAQADRAASVFI